MKNLTGTEVPLYDQVNTLNTWQVNGLGFVFPASVSIAANGYLLLVADDPTVFRARFHVPPEVPVLQYVGGLQDSGENLELQAPDIPTIDGVPYYETSYGKLDLNQIPSDNIARIEVTKGAASVLYGANAMGGVVNIVTKQAAEEPHTGATVEVGEDGLQRYVVTNGMRFGKFSYWLNHPCHIHYAPWAFSECICCHRLCVSNFTFTNICAP